jgi:predicted transcriptional regulator
MKRPYDFEDIRKRRDAGEKWASIAADYGRTKQAVEVAARRAAAPGEVSVLRIATKLVRSVYKEVRREVTP